MRFHFLVGREFRNNSQLSLSQSKELTFLDCSVFVIHGILVAIGPSIKRCLRSVINCSLHDGEFSCGNFRNRCPLCLHKISGKIR